ncbi:hypothetical protein PUN28_017311 [Cardiocondyla obscurior]|uniref:Uncharacterized protein n=1 Tax=Cardiocondyla obscurior TaxID=286306 RepID=A0AAW2ELB5_9HYME
MEKHGKRGKINACIYARSEKANLPLVHCTSNACNAPRVSNRNIILYFLSPRETTQMATSIVAQRKKKKKKKERERERKRRKKLLQSRTRKTSWRVLKRIIRQRRRRNRRERKKRNKVNTENVEESRSEGALEQTLLFALSVLYVERRKNGRRSLQNCNLRIRLRN